LTILELKNKKISAAFLWLESVYWCLCWPYINSTDFWSSCRGNSVFSV